MFGRFCMLRVLIRHCAEVTGRQGEREVSSSLIGLSGQFIIPAEAF